MEVRLKQGERIDDLHLKGLRIIQHPDHFCFGVDAVLVADFAKASAEDKVADLGTGTGIIPLMMYGKFGPKHIVGLEIQASSAEMARRSIALNGLEQTIEIMQGDIKEAAELLPLSCYDLVVANPPYMNAGKGLVTQASAKAIARHEIHCTLEDVIYAASRIVKVQGRFCMVHRPQRLVEIFETMRRHQMEPKRMRMVHPYADKDATMVLVEAVRQGRPQMKVEPPLVIYKADGAYHDEIIDIYGYNL